jgi:hypothetical protein
VDGGNLHAARAGPDERADRKPHTGTMKFRGRERIEDLLPVLRWQTHTDITDRHHAPPFSARGDLMGYYHSFWVRGVFSLTHHWGSNCIWCMIGAARPRWLRDASAVERRPSKFGTVASLLLWTAPRIWAFR